MRLWPLSKSITIEHQSVYSYYHVRYKPSKDLLEVWRMNVIPTSMPLLFLSGCWLLIPLYNFLTLPPNNARHRKGGSVQVWLSDKFWLIKAYQIITLNSSWPSATYMRRDFQCLFPQRPRYVALISVLISPVPHVWGVTNDSLLASPPNSRRSPAPLISPAPHICGASRTPILTRVVWKISNVVTKILAVLPDYRLP